MSSNPTDRESATFYPTRKTYPPDSETQTGQRGLTSPPCNDRPLRPGETPSRRTGSSFWTMVTMYEGTPSRPLYCRHPVLVSNGPGPRRTSKPVSDTLMKIKESNLAIVVSHSPSPCTLVTSLRSHPGGHREQFRTLGDLLETGTWNMRHWWVLRGRRTPVEQTYGTLRIKTEDTHSKPSWRQWWCTRKDRVPRSRALVNLTVDS